MTAVARPAPPGGSRSAGVAARRAMMRWARRMFRREWRQQVLVVVLLTVAVTAAVGSVTVVYNTTPPENTELGSANTLLRLDGTDPRALDAALAAARRRFATVEVVGHREVAVPGSSRRWISAAQDPGGAYGGELLALRWGAYPVGAGQVAVTDGVAKLLRLELGSTFALGGARQRVVGVVENPRALSDEFALVAPASAGAPDHVAVLVNASEASGRRVQRVAGRALALHRLRVAGRRSDRRRAGDVRRGHGLPAAGLAGRRRGLRGRRAAAAPSARDARGHGRDAQAPAPRPGDQRRPRRDARRGRRHARRPRAVGRGRPDVRIARRPSDRPVHRSLGIDRPDRVPRRPRGGRRRLVARAHRGPRTGHARALGTAAQAEARPRRGDRRGGAHRGRRRLPCAVGPEPAAAHHRRDRRDDPRLPAPGPAGDPGLRRPRRAGLDRPASGAARPRSLPGPFRRRARGGRPRARHRRDDRDHRFGRGGQASGAAAQPVRPAGTHPPRPAAARELIPELALRGVDPQAARVAQLAAQLDAGATIPLRKVYQPGEQGFFEPVADTRVLPTIEPARRNPGPMYEPEAQLFVATGAVLRYLGIDPATVDPGTDFLVDRSVPTDQLVFPGFPDRRDRALTNVRRIEVGRHLLGGPGFMDARKLAFITSEGLRRYGWKQVPAGWLVQARRTSRCGRPCPG